MRSKLISCFTVVSVVLLAVPMNAFGAGQSTDRNLSNNGIACINSQSTIAQSGNSRVSACTYTVTWNANGGSLAGSSSTSWTYGTSLTLPAAATRDGYTFNGWFTAQSGGTKVGNAGGSYIPTNIANFTIWAQWTENVTPPTISGISPTSGTTAGGTTLTITGSNLASVTSVSIGGISVTPTSISATSITVLTPSGSAGAKIVTVFAPSGPVDGNDVFTYVAPANPPTIQFTYYSDNGQESLNLQSGVSFDICEAGNNGNCVTITSGTSINSVISFSNTFTGSKQLTITYHNSDINGNNRNFMISLYSPDTGLEYVRTDTYFTTDGQAQNSQAIFPNDVSIQFGVFSYPIVSPINFVYLGEASSNGNAYGNLCSSGQANPCYVWIHDFNGHVYSYNNTFGPNATIGDSFTFSWPTSGQIFIEVGTVGETYTPCRIDLWNTGSLSAKDIYDGTSNTGNHLAGIDFIAAGNSVWFPSNIFNPGQTVYWTTSTNCQP